ncbi:uncharacterized protein [Chamaea fasciata]|uniref:uncharacterized protein isoform X1 n=1 Tax=Chamaea fasciata TaxID=190680 RepID=UPI00336AD4C1
MRQPRSEPGAAHCASSRRTGTCCSGRPMSSAIPGRSRPPARPPPPPPRLGNCGTRPHPAGGQLGTAWWPRPPRPSVSPPSAVAAHDPPVAAATEAREGAVVATGQAGMATRKEKRVEEARELLWHLEVACYKVRVLPLELLDGLGHIEAALEEMSPDVPKALADIVAKAKLLSEASARLTTCHLLVTLGEIHDLLSSRYGGSGGPGGPHGRVVTERCQRAVEDIPRLLEDSDVTDVMSRGQW